MKKKFLFCIVIVVSIIFTSIIAYASTQPVIVSKSKYISSEYGYLKGSMTATLISCGFSPTGKEKDISFSSTTNKKVNKIRSKFSLQYYTTGETIETENTGWINNANYAGITNCELCCYNKITKKKDGFVNTKVKAYGTSDAIVEKAYAVYVSCTY